jgi:uncharacterized protein (DUF2147 family)
MVRSKSSLAAVAAAAILTAIAAGPAAAAGDPNGIWLDDTGRGAVEIAPCGKALCGKVVWVKSARDRHGCGKAILGDVKAAGGGRWDYGWIFDPERGRNFDVELTPVGSNRLKVTGYAGIKLFSESRMWTRAPADLQRCDGAGGEKAAAEQAKEPVQQTAKAETGSPTNTDATVKKSDEPAKAAVVAEAVADETKDAPEPGPAAAPSRKRGTSAGGPGGLAFDKVLKRTADGRCKVDLPWVKFNFTCKDL